MMRTRRHLTHHPVRANERETDTATDTVTDTATDTATTDGPTDRHIATARVSERRAASGGRRPVGGGRPTGADAGIKSATQVATARRNRASGGGLCVIARGTKEQKPPFSVFFLPVYHGAFSKVYGAFFVWFLVGQDRVSVVVFMQKREELDVLRNQTVLNRP